MVLRDRRNINSVDFSLKACSGAMGIWVSSINFYINDIACPPQPQVWRMPKLNLKFHDSTIKFMFSKHQNKMILAIILLNSSSYVNLSTSVASFAPSTMMTSTASMTSANSLTSKMQALSLMSGFLGLSQLYSLFLWYWSIKKSNFSLMFDTVEASLWHLYEM